MKILGHKTPPVKAAKIVLPPLPFPERYRMAVGKDWDQFPSILMTRMRLRKNSRLGAYWMRNVSRLTRRDKNTRTRNMKRRISRQTDIMYWKNEELLLKKEGWSWKLKNASKQWKSEK